MALDFDGNDDGAVGVEEVGIEKNDDEKDVENGAIVAVAHV